MTSEVFWKKVVNNLTKIIMAKTAIILTPFRVKEVEKKLKELKKNSDKFEYEVIAIFDAVSQEEEQFLISTNNLKWLSVPEGTSKVAKKNIARFLISEDAKYMLFLSTDMKLSPEWLESRVKGMEVEPVLAIIGKLAEKITLEEQKKLIRKLMQFIHISDDDFIERCCLKDGSFRYVEEDNLATRVKVWDWIGGLSVSSDFSNLEYNARVQALGHGILPQPD